MQQKHLSSSFCCVQCMIDFFFHSICPAELQEQLDRAMRLEEERRRVEQEAARLEAERMEAIIAKEELARQAEDQIKSQEQLVSTRRKKYSSPSREKVVIGKQSLHMTPPAFSINTY